MIDLKVATPQNILNYADYLEKAKHFEEAFAVFEKGLTLFFFPHSFPIWITYLTKFVERYGGRKLERGLLYNKIFLNFLIINSINFFFLTSIIAREIFERVVSEAPGKDLKVFYLMYANLEEEFGLVRHAMSIYDRACAAVPNEDRFAMFSLYISRATETFGVSRGREIYDKALEGVPEKNLPTICIRYSELERRLGEIDRARAILTHGAQFSNPRMDARFWKKWKDFEIEHGNPDTYREMLRIRKSVEAKFSAQLGFVAGEILGLGNFGGNGKRLKQRNKFIIFFFLKLNSRSKCSSSSLSTSSSFNSIKFI